MNDSYNSWSEVLLVVGAGATAKLGMPQSDSQSKIFRALASAGETFEENKWKDYTIRDILSNKGLEKVLDDEQVFSGQNLEVLVAFFELLGNNLKNNWNVVSTENIENARVVFGNHDRELLESRIRELRLEYDWNALKQIIQICPHDSDNDNLIRDLFTIVDQKMAARQGIKVVNGFIAYNRMNGARNCAVLIIKILFASAWYKLSRENGSEDFKKYKAFAKTLASMMQKEGLKFQTKFPELQSRNFYLFTYSILNFNFEKIFERLLVFAHREANHAGRYLRTSQKQKIWLDFGVEQRFRNTRGKSGFGLSVDETVCQRINENKNVGSDIYRVGKFFFVHGSANWRECPACGCKFVYEAENWDLFHRHHNPPLPIPLFEADDFKRTKEEEKWKNELRLDSLECPSCGAETTASASPMIMQTMVKGIPTSFLEEIQRNAKVSLKKARHIILFGYSLPPDDIVWQEAFAEAVRHRMDEDERPFCSVVVGYRGEKRWLYDDELKFYLAKHKGCKDSSAYGIDAIENAISIFGLNHVRAYCGGIPDVWGNASEAEIKEILYPEWVDWKGTRLESFNIQTAFAERL